MATPTCELDSEPSMAKPKPSRASVAGKAIVRKRKLVELLADQMVEAELKRHEEQIERRRMAEEKKRKLRIELLENIRQQLENHTKHYVIEGCYFYSIAKKYETVDYREAAVEFARETGLGCFLVSYYGERANLVFSWDREKTIKRLQDQQSVYTTLAEIQMVSPQPPT